MASRNEDMNQRVSLLEHALSIQEEEINGIRAELIEAERLTNSVDRLGLGASALGDALLQVDKQQQVLTRLGQDLKRVEGKTEDAASKDEVSTQIRRMDAVRHRILYPAIVSVAVVALGFGFFISQAAYESCERRQHGTRVVAEVLGTFESPTGQTDPRITRGVERLLGTVAVSCEDQYPFRLPGWLN